MKKLALTILAIACVGLLLWLFGRYVATNYSLSSGPADPVYGNDGNFTQKDITFTNERVNPPSPAPRALQNNPRNINPASQASDTQETMQINVPLVDYRNGGQGIVFEIYTVPKDIAVLNAVYQKMFSLGSYPLADQTVGNAVSQSGLRFERVDISGAVARVYLNGSFRSRHSQDFALRNQIDAAAFQYPNINQIEVYINDTIFDWCITDLSDGEGGCPDIPQLWIDSR